jgi:hypothetical protein
MSRIPYAYGGIAILAAFVLSGCSGSSSTGSSNGGTGAAGGGGGAAADSLPAAAKSALAQITGAGGGVLDVAKLCAAVSAADVQALFKNPAPALISNPGECDWGRGNMTVDIYRNDTTKEYYTGGAVSSSGTPLAGVGDKALWSQPVQGQTMPFITSRKGTTDCTVSPGLNVDQSSIEYTGQDPFFKITDAAASKYASAEGQICNDIFQAGG